GARARAIQLPAWNEALGPPRPWDQQWSLRIQQILAYETDLLEYADLFEGSRVLDGLVAAVGAGAGGELGGVAAQRGGVDAGADGDALAEIRERVESVSGDLGHRLRILVGKPGLDGHSNGAEQIAVRARDVGMEVIYQGIRLTPDQIAASAVEEDVDVVGLSILSGSHRELVPRVVELLRADGADIPVVVGGIIPAADAAAMREAGVDGVYTPKDFEINRIMGEIAELVAERHRAAQPA